MTTRELSLATWPDFERLFSRGNGWDHCWCMAFQQRARFRFRAEAAVVNHAAKRALVEAGRAHGILVYADGEPVGWCQFGPADELRGVPIGDPDWRITCFVVDKRYRRRGVARLALRAALEAIGARGGGIIEAYPIAAWTHGRGGTTAAVDVAGVGPVAPAHGSFGNVSWPGTVAMFEREGFAAVSVFGSASARVRSLGARGCQVQMRRAL